MCIQTQVKVLALIACCYNCNNIVPQVYNCNNIVQQGYNCNNIVQQGYNCNNIVPQGYNCNNIVLQGCNCNNIVLQGYNCINIVRGSNTNCFVLGSPLKILIQLNSSSCSKIFYLTLVHCRQYNILNMHISLSMSWVMETHTNATNCIIY